MVGRWERGDGLGVKSDLGYCWDRGADVVDSEVIVA